MSNQAQKNLLKVSLLFICLALPILGASANPAKTKNIKPELAPAAIGPLRPFSGIGDFSNRAGTFRDFTVEELKRTEEAANKSLANIPKTCTAAGCANAVDTYNTAGGGERRVAETARGFEREAEQRQRDLLDRLQQDADAGQVSKRDLAEINRLFANGNTPTPADVSGASLNTKARDFASALGTYKTLSREMKKIAEERTARATTAGSHSERLQGDAQLAQSIGQGTRPKENSDLSVYPPALGALSGRPGLDSAENTGGATFTGARAPKLSSSISKSGAVEKPEAVLAELGLTSAQEKEKNIALEAEQAGAPKAEIKGEAKGDTKSAEAFAAALEAAKGPDAAKGDAKKAGGLSDESALLLATYLKDLQGNGGDTAARTSGLTVQATSEEGESASEGRGLASHSEGMGATSESGLAKDLFKRVRRCIWKTAREQGFAQLRELSQQ